MIFKRLLPLLIFAFSPFLTCANEPYYVGDLGKEWEFGSDHLPTGISVNHHHFVSWNILDKRFIHWIETNEQGLKESAIIRDNVPLRPDSSLTIREERIIQQIIRMATHPTHPRSMIALQETNEDVYWELKKRLPSSYAAVSHQNAPQAEIIFYDQNLFQYVESVSALYTNAKNSWLILTLKDRNEGTLYKIFHSHVPGGAKSKEAMHQLAEAVAAHYDKKSINLIMGDQNRPPHVFFQALSAQCRDHSFDTWHVPYPTHINTKKEASWIDNLFLAGHAVSCRVSESAHEFFSELDITIQLLKKYRPHR